MSEKEKDIQAHLEWVAKIQGTPDILDTAGQDNRYEVSCPKCGFTEVIPPAEGEKGSLFGVKFTCKKCKKSFRHRR